ncbi:MAG TPA: hypothetical protein V6D17_06025 [Candidatus Obscuribacterales bacterium]
MGWLYDSQGRIAQAKGEVTVSAEDDIELRLGEEALSPDLSFLTRLDADDLQSVSVEIRHFGDDELKLMSHLTGLKALNLRLSRVTNECFKTLKQMTSLTVLDVAYTRVTCEGIAELSGIPLLSLNISHTLPNEDGLCELGTLKQIHQLLYMDNGISLKGMQSLSRLTELEHLFLTRTNIENDYLSLMIAFKNLLLIDLSKTPITDEGTRHLPLATSLRGVLLDDTNTGDDTVDHLTPLQYLFVLSMRNTNITDKAIARLSIFPYLRTLALSKTGITDDAIRDFAALRSLEQLEILSTRISREGLERLTHLCPQVSILVGEEEVSEARASAPAEGREHSPANALRAQIFELIVKSALEGAPWREEYAVAMEMNMISAEEVESEIKRRQRRKL